METHDNGNDLVTEDLSGAAVAASSSSTFSSRDKAADTDEPMRLSDYWKHWAKVHGLPWPDDRAEEDKRFRAIGAIMDDESVFFVRRYVTLCESIASERVNARLAPHMGMLRARLFFAVSYHFDMISWKQKMVCDAHPLWSERITNVDARSFVVHNAMYGVHLLDALESALASDMCKNVTDEQIEHALNDTTTSSDPSAVGGEEDVVDINIDTDVLSQKLKDAAPNIPKWLVAYVLCLPADPEMFTAVEVARILMLEFMDVCDVQCTLADVSVALRGVSVMDNFLKLSKRKTQYDAVLRTSKSATMFSKFGVRNAVDLEEDVYEKKHADRLSRFAQSLANLYEYITAEEKPKIRASEYNQYKSTKKCEVRLAVMLRRAKERASERDENGESRTVIESIYQVFQREKMRAENREKAKTGGGDGEDDADTLYDVSKKSFFDEMKNISVETAIIWLHCSFASSSTIADFWWAMEGAQMLYKLVNRELGPVSPPELSSSSKTESSSDKKIKSKRKRKSRK